MSNNYFEESSVVHACTCGTCREPRGFGFVKFQNPEDAADAKDHMDRQVIGGREIRIVFAEENRKTPQEMRVTSRVRCSPLFILAVTSLSVQLQTSLPFKMVLLQGLHPTITLL